VCMLSVRDFLRMLSVRDFLCMLSVSCVCWVYPVYDECILCMMSVSCVCWVCACVCWVYPVYAECTWLPAYAECILCMLSVSCVCWVYVTSCVCWVLSVRIRNKYAGSESHSSHYLIKGLLGVRNRKIYTGSEKPLFTFLKKLGPLWVSRCTCCVTNHDACAVRICNLWYAAICCNVLCHESWCLCCAYLWLMICCNMMRMLSASASFLETYDVFRRETPTIWA
jgi:hypothetical protein